MITFAPFPEIARRHRLQSSTLKIPALEGLIRRRLLVNFRVDPAAMRRHLPARFRPKLHRGHAITGLCLIRLEQIRPVGVPSIFGWSSENAAHRVAVEWTNPQGLSRDGVFIFRRDTNSTLGQLAGGRLFPGIHHPAEFEITDAHGEIGFNMITREGDADIRVQGMETDALPPDSCFGSLAESSKFFENGSLGYSPARHLGHFDGLRLETDYWSVRPFAVSRVTSSWLATNLPGAQFDHALLMRDIPHRWYNAERQP